MSRAASCSALQHGVSSSSRISAQVTSQWPLGTASRQQLCHNIHSTKKCRPCHSRTAPLVSDTNWVARWLRQGMPVPGALRCIEVQQGRSTPRILDPNWPPNSAGREQAVVARPSNVSRSAAAESSLRSSVGLELVESLLQALH